MKEVGEEVKGSTVSGPRLRSTGDSLVAVLGTDGLCSTGAVELRETGSLVVTGSSGAEVSLGKKGSTVREG